MNGMQRMETKALGTDAERRRVHAVVEALARTRQPGFTAAEVAHDARNMVTALDLYCELLGEPGVLTPESEHYAGELRLVASASRRLIEKLMLLDSREDSSLGEAMAPANKMRSAGANADRPLEGTAAQLLKETVGQLPAILLLTTCSGRWKPTAICWMRWRE